MPSDSSSRGRPQVIYPEYVERIAKRCNLEIDHEKVLMVVAKFYKIKVNRSYPRFLRKATILLYRASIVLPPKQWTKQKTKKANKQLAITFWMDCLVKNGYKIQLNMGNREDLESLIGCELTTKTLKKFRIKDLKTSKAGKINPTNSTRTYKKHCSWK